MARWEVTDDLGLDLWGVQRVVVRAVGGLVRVVGSAGPVRLGVDHVEGKPVEVAVEGGTLRVCHPGVTDTPGADSAFITVQVPASAEVDIRTGSADVEMIGLAAPPRVQSDSGHVAVHTGDVRKLEALIA